MAEMSDLKDWATRNAGDEDVAPAPEGAAVEDGEEDEASEPADAYQYAANELQEAVDALEALPEDEDSDWRAECVTALKAEQEKLQQKVEDLGGADDEAVEEEETPEPELV